MLLGPQQSPDPRLADDPRIHMPGPVPYDDLPLLAGFADVLVMPYDDLPVTRAIQPLKHGGQKKPDGMVAQVRRYQANAQTSMRIGLVDVGRRLAGQRRCMTLLPDPVVSDQRGLVNVGRVLLGE